MARPIKKALDYFPLDTNIFNDRKIKRFVKNYGGKGFAVYIYLLTQIYGDNGYYLEYDSEYPADIVDELGEGYDETTVMDIIKSCALFGLFDGDLLVKKGILTSKSIQKRYIECKGINKENYSLFICAEYDLINENTDKQQEKELSEDKNNLIGFNFIKPNLIEFNSEKQNLTELNSVSSLKEKKRKETKLKEKKLKENNIKENNFVPGGTTTHNFKKPSLDEIADYAEQYISSKGYIVNFNPERFFDFYESKGWMVGKSKMKDWEAAVRNWINNDNPAPANINKTSSLNENKVLKEFLNGQ